MQFEAKHVVYRTHTDKVLDMELKRTVQVREIVARIIQVIHMHKLEPNKHQKAKRRNIQSVVSMLIGQLIFYMGAYHVPEQDKPVLDDGLFFSKELINAIPDEYIIDYLRNSLSSGAVAVSEAEASAVVEECGIKKMWAAAIDELILCSKHANVKRVVAKPRKVKKATGVHYVVRGDIGDIVTAEISEDTYNMLVSRHNKANCVLDVDDLVCSLLMRYSALGSGANQYGMPKVIKDEFRNKLGINMELLSSSLNSYYDNYCSIFEDLEQYFGSSGSIKNIRPISGIFMANPPYEHMILELMMDLFCASLEAAEKGNKLLVFAFGLPYWTDDPPLPFYSKFTKSKYYMGRIILQDAIWEELTTGRKPRLGMKSYRCLMGHIPDDNGNVKKNFAMIVDQWQKL